MRLIVVATFAAMAVSSASAQVFTGLGFLPGDTFSKATAISGDGSSVAGEGPRQTFGDARACWRWRADTGLTDLGGSGLNATAISFDGNVIVGSHLDVPGNLPAFRWTAGSGAQVLTGIYRSTLPSPGISGDGQVVVGSTTSSGTGDPVRWTSATGAVAIPNPPASPIARGDVTNAYATNHDGSVVVGWMVAQLTGQPTGYVAPFRWVAGSGTQAITDGDGVPIHGAAHSISADGDTVLVVSGSTVQRWRSDTGALTLPGLVFNGSLSEAVLSGDGNTVTCVNNIWNIDNGTRPLTTLLTSAGCNFSGWSNLIVTGTDFSGHTFCGYGTDPQGLTQAWYATVPSPASVLALAPLLLTRRRRA